MALGSTDQLYRRAFKKDYGAKWKEDVTSRFRAEQLIKELEIGGTNSYIVRKVEHLQNYVDSGTTLSLIAWENEVHRR